MIHANPKVEICAFKNGEWLRAAGLPCRCNYDMDSTRNGEIEKEY